MKQNPASTYLADWAHLSPDVWYCASSEEEILQVSDRLVDEFGFAPKEVIGLAIGKVLSNEAQWHQLHQLAKQSGRVKDHIIEIKSRKGSKFTTSVSCVWHDEKELYYGNIRDITEREEELKAERESYLNFVDVVNSTLDGMLIVNKMNQMVIDANHKALDILGYSMEEITSVPIGKATMAEDEEIALFLELLEQNKDMRIERKVRHKSGRIIDLEISARMMHVGEGQLFQSVIRDITQKKRLFKLEKLKEEVLGIKIKGLPTEGIIQKLCSQLEEIGAQSDLCYFSFEKGTEACEFASRTHIPKDIQTLFLQDDEQREARQSFFSEAHHNLIIDEFLEQFPKANDLKWPYLSWCSFPIYTNTDLPVGVFVVLSRSGRPIPEGDLESITQLMNILGNVFQKIDQENQLITSENRYRELVDHSPMAIGVYASEQIVFANDEFYQILKLERIGRVVAQDLVPYVADSQMEQVRQMVDQVRKKGFTPITELNLQHKDGQQFTVMIQSTKVEYQNQEAIQFVFYDISERKRFEVRLKDREILLNTTGSVAKVGGWQLTQADRKLTWTDQNYVIHGMEVGQHVTLEKALQFYHPNDQHQILEAIENAFAGESFELTLALQLGSGQTMWVEYSGRPVYENDKVVKLIGAQRDITQYIHQIEEIRENEQKLKNANQLARLGNWEWTIGTDQFYWSEELYHIFGIEEQAHPTMELFEQILDKSSSMQFYELLQNMLKGGPPAHVEFTFNKDEELRHIVLRATNEISDDGRVLKVLGTIQDITQRKLMELEKDTIYRYNKVLLELEALASWSENISALIDAYATALVDEIGFNCMWIADHPGGVDKPVFTAMKGCVNDKTGLTESMVQLFFDSEPYHMAVRSRSMVVTELPGRALDEPWEQAMADGEMKTFIVVPFIRDEKVRGTFSLFSKKTKVIDRSMQNFLSQLIHDCGHSIYALELKRTRDELNEYNKLLVDSLDVVSISFDPQTSKLSIAGNTNKLVGYSVKDFEEKVKHGYEYVHPNDLKKIRDQIAKSKKKLGNFDVDFRFRRHDKKTVWLNAIGKIYWEGKTIRKVAGILINMDQRKQKEVNHVKTHIDIRDQERIRIARELHDSLGQTLTIASMSLDAMSEDVKNLKEDRQELYHDAYKLVNDAMDETRTISHNLMPSLLMDFGLVKSIRSDIQKLNKAGQIEFDFEYDEDCDQRYAQEIELNFYNIIREAVKNIIKHSHASAAKIQLRSSDSILMLLIEDNGVGWKKNKTISSGGLGMSSLESRAVSMGAEYYVSGENGCEIRVELDLDI